MTIDRTCAAEEHRTCDVLTRVAQQFQNYVVKINVSRRDTIVEVKTNKTLTCGNVS